MLSNSGIYINILSFLYKKNCSQKQGLYEGDIFDILMGFTDFSSFKDIMIDAKTVGL